MWKKPLALKIVIWICVVFMVVSLIWVYVVYMFSPVQENSDWNLDQGITDANTGIILPEIDAEDPENADTVQPAVLCCRLAAATIRRQYGKIWYRTWPVWRKAE